MLKRNLFLLLTTYSISLLCFGCKQEPFISDHEMKALNAVVEHYGGSHITLNKKVSTIESESLQYLLEIHNLDMNQYHKSPKMCGNVSAWLFLSALGDNGRKAKKLSARYHFDGELYEFTTDLAFFRLACTLNPRLAEIDSFFRTENYEALVRMISPIVIQEDERKSFQAALVELDKVNGKVEKQNVTGVEEVSPKGDTTKTWIQFYANHKRGQKYHWVKIVFDPYEAVTPIIGISTK